MNGPLIADVNRCVAEYLKLFPQDESALRPLVGLLKDGVDVTTRKEFCGHVTCSAVVFNDRNQVLQIHHRILDRWFPPAGHLEETDATLLDAAKREFEEETGIPASRLEIFAAWEMVPFGFDRHPIPANPKRGEPEHFHNDFRWAFRLKGEVLAQIQIEEVKGWRWAELDEVASDLRPQIPRIL